MGTIAPSDEALLAGPDPAAFEQFYLPPRRDAARVLRAPYRRPRPRRRPHGGDVRGRARGPAPLPAREGRGGARGCSASRSHKLADAQRRGYAERRARRRMGMERLELHEDDYARIESLAEAGGRHGAARAAGPRPARRGPRARPRGARLRRDRARPGDDGDGRAQARQPRPRRGPPTDGTSHDDRRLRHPAPAATARRRRARGTLRRARARPSGRSPSPALATALAVLIGALAVVAGALLLRDEPQPAGPQVVGPARADRQPRGDRLGLRLALDRRPGGRRRRAGRPGVAARGRAHPGRLRAGDRDQSGRQRAVGPGRAAAPRCCGSTPRRTR